MMQDWVRKANEYVDTSNYSRQLSLEFKIWIGSSHKKQEISDLAQYVQDFSEKKFGARVLSKEARYAPHDSSLVQQKINDADLILMFAATPGVSVEALDICYRSREKNGTTKDKMIVYMPTEYRDGFICNLLHSFKATIRYFPERDFLQSSDAKLFLSSISDITDAQLDLQRKKMLHLDEFKPRIGIITALPVELCALKNIVEDLRVDPKREKDTIYNEYYHGMIKSNHGGEHYVVVALAGKGNNKAAVLATDLLSQYPSVDEVFMVGVAAGVPDLKDAMKHVRLGDLVVCDEYGVIEYDMVKKNTGRTETNPPPRPPSPHWLTRIQNYMAMMSNKPGYWSYLDEILEETRCSRPKKGPLRDCPWVKGKKAVRQPVDPSHDRTRPKIHMGPIASANTVLKTATIRDKLKVQFKVKAVEMEASGIAEAAWQYGKGYFVIRGVCDFANDDKNKVWQPYASAAAAAFTRELIETMPVETEPANKN